MTTVTSITRLDGRNLPSALEEDWNRLAGDVPCRHWQWLEPWWRYYAKPGDELFVLVARDQNGQVHGIAPWYLSSSLTCGRVLRFLGSGDVCSDYLTIMASSEAQSSVVERIAEYLTCDASNDWDLMELAGVEAEDDRISCLIEQLALRGYRAHQQAAESCWRLELPTKWDDYLTSLSKSRRERTRQIIRRLYDNGRAVTRGATSAAELPRIYDLLVELHQKRRRSLGDAGCFADPTFTGYHREVLERFFALGRLRLQYTLLDDRPIAVEYGLLGEGTIYFYQSGIETEVLDQRPGWIGTIGSLRSAIEQGYRTFDFMRGDEAYKSSWGALPRAMIETRIVARRAAPKLRHTAWLARQQVRRWAKAGLRRLGSNNHEV